MIINELVRRVPNATEVFINSLNRSVFETIVSPISNSFGDNTVASNVLREISMFPSEIYYLWNGTELGTSGIIRDLGMSGSQFFKSSAKPIMIYSLSSELGFGKLSEVGRYANYIIDPIAKIPAVMSYAKQGNSVTKSMGYYQFTLENFQNEWIITGMIGGLTGVVASEVVFSYLIGPLNINTKIRIGINSLQNLSLEKYLNFMGYNEKICSFDSQMNLLEKLSLIPNDLDNTLIKVIISTLEFSKSFITHSINYTVAAPFVRSAFDMVVNPLLKNQQFITDLTNISSQLVKISTLTSIPFVTYALYEYYYNSNVEYSCKILQETFRFIVNLIPYTLTTSTSVAITVALISNPVSYFIEDYTKDSDYLLGQIFSYTLEITNKTLNIPINSLCYIYDQFIEYNQILIDNPPLINDLDIIHSSISTSLSSLCNNKNRSIEECTNSIQKLIQKIVDKSSHEINIPNISFYHYETNIIAESILYEELNKVDDTNWDDYLLSFFNSFSSEEILNNQVRMNQSSNDVAVIKFDVVNNDKGICEKHAHVINDLLELNRTEYVTDDFTSCFIELTE